MCRRSSCIECRSDSTSRALASRRSRSEAARRLAEPAYCRPMTSFSSRRRALSRTCCSSSNCFSSALARNSDWARRSACLLDSSARAPSSSAFWSFASASARQDLRSSRWRLCARCTLWRAALSPKRACKALTFCRLAISSSISAATASMGSPPSRMSRPGAGLSPTADGVPSGGSEDREERADPWRGGSVASPGRVEGLVGGSADGD
mmetsp:Transcript_74452/g.241746  ORF Transcript_74452/g.241746 Transcript_74452/m.241746 type:complete len:208 (-) Transcript_74452:2-625(-)